LASAGDGVYSDNSVLVYFSREWLKPIMRDAINRNRKVEDTMGIRQRKKVLYHVTRTGQEHNDILIDDGEFQLLFRRYYLCCKQFQRLMTS
jgi:hypothetical protein